MGIASISNNGVYTNNSQSISETTGIATNPVATVQQDSEASTAENQNLSQSKKEANKQALSQKVDEMNQIMAALNTDLKFALHEKTHQLMVRFVDSKDKKVLKEFPPHEFLDTVAKIRAYVGILLDKKV